MNPDLAPMCLSDEVRKHLFGRIEVGDDAFPHGTDSDEVARRTAEHVFGFLSHGLDVTGVAVDRYHGRLINDNTASACVHKGVGGSEVDGEIGRKHAG